MRFNQFSPVILLLSAVACEPVSPILEGNGPNPADGQWRMKIVDAESHGNCGMFSDSDLIGLTMGMSVETRDETGIRFQIEGMELKGTMDSGWLYATGRLVESAASTVYVEVEIDPDVATDDDDGDWDHEGNASSDSDARTQTPDEDGRPGLGVHTLLEGITLTRDTMEGELSIEYDMPDLQCVLVLDFDAQHMDRTESEPPIAEPVEPHETEEPKEEPVDSDED